MVYEAIKIYIRNYSFTQVHGYKRCENITLNTIKKSFFDSYDSLGWVMVCIQGRRLAS